MNRLVSHIEFLLHHHNCVIIPDFGGFVVNAVHSREGEGGLSYHLPASWFLTVTLPITTG